jgi:hypothetical protein
MIIEQLHDEQSAKLLAKANLLRMRKQWDEAVTCCMQVLYHSPDSWSAHALLGDIYADQDRPEEAIQWYCMTLDIRPDAQLVREKLSKVVNSRRHQIVQAINPTRPYMNRDGRTFHGGVLGKLSWYWSAPERKRLLVVAGVILAVFAIVLAPQLVGSRSNRGSAAAVFTEGPAPTNTALVLAPVTPASKSGATGGSAPGGSTPLPEPNPPIASSSARAAEIIRDPNDEAMTDTLQTDTGLRAQGVEVTDAELNPPNSSLTVTFVSTGPPAPTTDARIMRDALSAARVALQSQAAGSATSCTVRCLTVPASAEPPTDSAQAQAPVLTFSATVSRDSIPAQGTDIGAIAPPQLPGFFTDMWWSSSAAPS